MLGRDFYLDVALHLALLHDAVLNVRVQSLLQLLHEPVHHRLDPHRHLARPHEAIHDKPCPHPLFPFAPLSTPVTGDLQAWSGAARVPTWAPGTFVGRLFLLRLGACAAASVWRRRGRAQRQGLGPSENTFHCSQSVLLHIGLNDILRSRKYIS
jgi:hypothetical protein